MDTFFFILHQLIPLYALIGLGFIAGRFLRIERESVAALLIYIICPIVFFFGTSQLQFEAKYLLLPILYFAISSFVCVVALKLAGRWWTSPDKNILAFTSASSNSGYFGLPVAVFLFGEKCLSVAILVSMGYFIFEGSIGFFVTARGHHTTRESFMRVLRLPTLYACLAGLVCSAYGIKVPSLVAGLSTSFRGAYLVLGMMMIGIGISKLKSFRPNFSFVGYAFMWKFLAWPFFVYLLIAIDRSFLHLFSADIYSIMALMSVVPVAANSVALASLLKANPEQTAITVLLSTVFALFYIPAVVHLISQVP